MSRPAFRIVAAELLTAMFARLREDLPDVRVADDFPDPAVPPFVVFGEYEQEDQRSKSGAAGSASVRLEVYSTAGGFLEATSIGDRLVESITRERLETASATFSPAGVPFVSARRAQHTGTGEVYRQVSIRIEFLVARRKES